MHDFVENQPQHDGQLTKPGNAAPAHSEGRQKTDDRRPGGRKAPGHQKRDGAEGAQAGENKKKSMNGAHDDDRRRNIRGFESNNQDGKR